jgi:hypothetical protein
MPLETAMMSYAGLACWALSTKRLRRDLALPRLPAPPIVRATAVALLAAAAWLAVLRFGPYQGPVAWIGLLCLAGVILLLLLSHFPRFAMGAAAAMVALTPLSLIIAP